MSRYYLNQTAWVDGADPPTEQVRTCLGDSMWPVTNGITSSGHMKSHSCEQNDRRD